MVVVILSWVKYFSTKSTYIFPPSGYKLPIYLTLYFILYSPKIYIPEEYKWSTSITDHFKTQSERAPQEIRSLQDCRTCTPHYPTLMYILFGHEMCAGPSMYIMGRKSSQCDFFPIGNFSQQGTYPDSPTWGEATGPCCFKAHVQREPKHQGGPQSRPDPLLGHPPGSLHPDAPYFSPNVLMGGE